MTKQDRALIGAALEILSDEYARCEIDGDVYLTTFDCMVFYAALAKVNDLALNYAMGNIWDKDGERGGWLVAAAVERAKRMFSRVGPLPGPRWYAEADEAAVGGFDGCL